MSESLSLLPCPFCGGRPQFNSCVDYDQVFCCGCGCRTVEVRSVETKGPFVFDRKGRVAAIWNTRVSSRLEEKMQIRKIFIDMDGVLADFDGWKAAARAHMPKVDDDDKGVWEVIKEIDHFYYQLAVLPDAQYMFAYLKNLNIPLCILTALPRRFPIENAETDKLLWIRKHIDKDVEFRTGPYAVDKQNHCEPGFVLIDDNKKNIEQWSAKGGIAIYHTSVADTLRQIESLLSRTS